LAHICQQRKDERVSAVAEELLHGWLDDAYELNKP
jgi:hypothetical protein